MKRHFAAACIALSIAPAWADSPAEQQAAALRQRRTERDGGMIGPQAGDNSSAPDRKVLR